MGLVSGISVSNLFWIKTHNVNLQFTVTIVELSYIITVTWHHHMFFVVPSYYTIQDPQSDDKMQMKL